MINQENLDTLYHINDTAVTSSAIALLDVSVIDRKDDYIKLSYEGKTYHVNVKDITLNGKVKSAKININGYDHDITIKETIDQLIDELGFLTKTKQSVKEVKSMMPGLVVACFVNEGDHVDEGDKLISLEAMKMENIIKSPGSGVVKTIYVSPKQAIEKNQILISFE